MNLLSASCCCYSALLLWACISLLTCIRTNSFIQHSTTSSSTRTSAAAGVLPGFHSPSSSWIAVASAVSAHTNQKQTSRHWNSVSNESSNANKNNNVDSTSKSNSLSPLTTRNPNLNRGDKYNSYNSTMPSPAQVAKRLNVKPTAEASAKTWKRAWNTQKRMIPIMHYMDSCKPTDSSLNIACMWWKALSGNDINSPVHDNGLAYDLLPSGWRKIASRRVTRFYPRLHHGNVELRTAYLDKAVTDIVQEVKDQDQDQKQDQEEGNASTSRPIKIRLVCMGAGYDTRGIKMLERGIADKIVELDLPEVVHSKQRLFTRLQKRRPSLANISMPTLIPSDFNDIPDVKKKLEQALEGDIDEDADANFDWYTIFLFEGVMIYLNDGVPSSLLNITSDVLKERGLKGSLCLADRLENVPGGDEDLGEIELTRNGWNIVDWCPKPGLARHMLSARLL